MVIEKGVLSIPPLFNEHIYLVFGTMENSKRNMDMASLYSKLFRNCYVNTRFLVVVNLKSCEYMNLVKDIVP